MGKPIDTTHWNAARAQDAGGAVPEQNRQIAPVGNRIPLSRMSLRRFIVSVDTEEEFDWNAPFNRASNTSSTIVALPEATAWFNAADVKPVYLCDWPVMDNPQSSAIIAALHADKMCEVGAHLHPWVTPPHSEDVTRHNSFTGNLPEALQWEKTLALTKKIADVIGVSPTVFRAGRYGLGPSTHAMLAALGYKFDVSVRPQFDYSDEGGPDFTHHPAWPWRTPEGLIELPLSTVRVGPLRRFTRLPKWRGMSLLSQRVPLTPEGTPLIDAISAIRRLHADGLEVFSLSFHSPTLTPGHTSYVKDATDLAHFWRWWDGVINEFERLRVRPSTHEELYPHLTEGE
jgi:hypothetical protein